MRALLAVLAAMLALIPALWTARAPRVPGIVARALPASHFGRTGALRFLGGWALESRDRRFGGFSGLAVVGDRLVLLSDAGRAVTIRAGPRGVAAEGWLDVAGPGTKAARDSESIARDPSSHRWWIGFEGMNLIARRAGLILPEAAVRPPAMRRWPANGGAESLARLPDGRFVVIAETARRPDGARDALFFPGDPTTGVAPLRFGYRPPAGMDPSDAAALPDGRLLVLDRRLGLRGWEAALAVIDPAGLRPGALVAGRVLAHLAGPVPIDNMEGVTVARADGRTIVWLVSDDNFLPVQRTLLLKFALAD